MRGDKIPVWGLAIGLSLPALCLAGGFYDDTAPLGDQAVATSPGDVARGRTASRAMHEQLPPTDLLAQAPAEQPKQPLWDQEDAQSQARTDLMGWTVRRIEGEGVHNAQGEKIGSISEIARNRQDRSVAAVISVGGFLGLGSTKVAVPIGELRLEGERVVIATAITPDELKSQPAYEAGQYEALDSGMRLEDATRSHQSDIADGPAIRFEDLDEDGDGHISQQEAAGHPQLTERWSRYDTDGNGRLDEAEFSAFEVESQR